MYTYIHILFIYTFKIYIYILYIYISYMYILYTYKNVLVRIPYNKTIILGV